MSAGAQRYDTRHLGWLMLLVAIATIGTWIYCVIKTQDAEAIRQGETWLLAILLLPKIPKLWVLPLMALIFSMWASVEFFRYYRTYFGGGAYEYKLRGPEMISEAALIDKTKERRGQLYYGNVPMPTKVDHLHGQIIGSTGTGKSLVLAGYIESAMNRGDRQIVVDPGGGFMSQFFKEGDVILNPFDKRCAYWSIFHEIRADYDVETYAVSLIPRSPSTEQEQWNAMARTIVAETMHKLRSMGMGDTASLIRWLTMETNESLQELLKDTAAGGMFHGANDTLGSVRTVLTRYVAAHKYLLGIQGKEEIFSLRDWLSNGKGNLWITWQEDMLQALKPLIACLIDVIGGAVLAGHDEDRSNLHMVIDELDSLDKLNYLVPAATKARKHRFTVQAGFQSYAQLKETNGENDAMTLRNSLRNTVVLGIDGKDTFSCEEASKSFGDHEVVRRSLSIANGKKSESMQTVRERVIMPSEISILPERTGYLKFAGDYPICRFTVPLKIRPKVTEGIKLIDNAWASQDGATLRTRLFN